MSRGHQEWIGPLVSRALKVSGLSPAHLTRVGATVGPGSFTGLRVGLAFARAFALARNIDCVGVTTLEVLAGEGEDEGLVVAVIPSRDDFHYVQLFRDGAPVTAPDMLRPADIAARIIEVGGGAPALLIGPQVEDLKNVAPRAAVVVRPHVSGTALHQKIRTMEYNAPPRPLYLRPPDARTLDERRSHG